MNSISIDAWKNLVNLAKANGNSLKHARTYEIVLFTSLYCKRKIKFAKKLNDNTKVLLYPASSYHKHQNQKLYSKFDREGNLKEAYRFILKDNKIIAQKIGLDANGNYQIKNIKPKRVKHKPSKQWKSVYPKPKSKSHKPERIPLFSTFNTLNKRMLVPQQNRKRKLSKKEKYRKKLYKYLSRLQ